MTSHVPSEGYMLKRKRIGDYTVVNVGAELRRSRATKVHLFECAFANAATEKMFYDMLLRANVSLFSSTCSVQSSGNDGRVSANICKLIASPKSRLVKLYIGDGSLSIGDIGAIVAATCSRHSKLAFLNARRAHDAETNLDEICASFLNSACTLKDFGIYYNGYYVVKDVLLPHITLRKTLADPRCKLDVCEVHSIKTGALIKNRKLEAVLEQFAEAHSTQENWLPVDIIRLIGVYLRQDCENRDGHDPPFAFM